MMRTITIGPKRGLLSFANDDALRQQINHASGLRWESLEGIAFAQVPDDSDNAPPPNVAYAIMRVPVRLSDTHRGAARAAAALRSAMSDAVMLGVPIEADETATVIGMIFNEDSLQEARLYEVEMEATEYRTRSIVQRQAIERKGTLLVVANSPEDAQRIVRERMDDEWNVDDLRWASEEEGRWEYAADIHQDEEEEHESSSVDFTLIEPVATRDTANALLESQKLAVSSIVVPDVSELANLHDDAEIIAELFKVDASF
jgi:hypothetical protein